MPTKVIASHFALIPRNRVTAGAMVAKATNNPVPHGIPEKATFWNAMQSNPSAGEAAKRMA